MIDPMTQLALAVHTTKGVYALLVGSGISRPSGIPTGWEVVLDLIRKLAQLNSKNCEPDPAAWFENEYAKKPGYSNLLDELAKTSTERQQLLKGYFEPTEEERRDGLKSPTTAHKAIAQLVASGYIKVILTTNFDRLMERAIEEQGIVPTVISSVDQFRGAMPLVHTQVTIVKLHGDYSDIRIKNTEQELDVYDSEIDAFLDRVLDEYGLVISGWSCEWDIALRKAIERCPSRRFTTFWTSRSSLSERAAALAMHRNATIVNVKDADTLFHTLFEKVRSLEDISAAHPLSAKLAVATVKRYLDDRSSKIRLGDLVFEETENLHRELNSSDFAPNETQRSENEVIRRIDKYNSLCETLVAIMAAGCYYGESDVGTLWFSALQRIANANERLGGVSYLLDLQKYPALLLLYAGGIAAVAAERYDTLSTLLTRTKVLENDEYKLITSIVYPERIISKELMNKAKYGNNLTPVSDHLFEVLREALRRYVPIDKNYERVFDTFEYLFALVYADSEKWVIKDGWWGPVGAFLWRGSRYNVRDNYTPSRIEDEIENSNEDWLPIKGGLFGGSLLRAKEAKKKFDAFLSTQRR